MTRSSICTWQAGRAARTAPERADTAPGKRIRPILHPASGSGRYRPGERIRAVPTGRCPPGGGRRAVGAGRCPPGGAHRVVGAGRCAPGGLRRVVGAGWWDGVRGRPRTTAGQRDQDRRVNHEHTGLRGPAFPARSPAGRARAARRLLRRPEQASHGVRHPAAE
ncbi:hypothetical protein OG244_38180 [Streptomyces brevispora]|uniref:hypothetical protein n=1 Tax=Streptomyces brevispora TaxID=887462 RepID=UPI002E30423C|nr:hypothetical protein [Streptomyces brevispora]